MNLHGSFVPRFPTEMWNSSVTSASVVQEFCRYECVLSKKISQLLSDDIWSNTKFFWRREDRIEQETSWRYSLWSDLAATFSRDFFFFYRKYTVIWNPLQNQPATVKLRNRQRPNPTKSGFFRILLDFGSYSVISISSPLFFNLIVASLQCI
jgi:hypothetical protein